MTGEETGDGVEAAALPAPSPCGHAQRSKVDGDHQQGWSGILSEGRGGGSSSWKRQRKTLHYGMVILCRSWRTRPQIPYATTPRGGTLGKFGSPGMMNADDGQDPPRRDGTNLNPPPPCTTSCLRGDP